MESDWTAFFIELGPEKYLEEGFTKNTLFEVDFIIDVCGLPEGARVLDMGCGPGRHSRELARRGFHVTGVDFTEPFLRYAIDRAAADGLSDHTEFVLSDARDFVRPDAFDAAVCLCEGSFNLLLTDADHQRVLSNIATSLKPGAPFLLTSLNAYRVIRRAGEEGILDPITMVETWHENGRALRGRMFVVPELVEMHRAVGLTVQEIWGGTAGQWGKRPLDWDEMEVMLLSRKG